MKKRKNLGTPVRSSCEDKAILFAQHFLHHSQRFLSTCCCASRAGHSSILTVTLAKSTVVAVDTFRARVAGSLPAKPQQDTSFLSSEIALIRWYDSCANSTIKITLDRLVRSSERGQWQSPEFRFLSFLHDADALGQVQCNTHDTKS